MTLIFLKAARPLMIVAIERCGHLALDPSVRQRLLAMSAATIDRLLEPTRQEGVGQRRETCMECSPLLMAAAP